MDCVFQQPLRKIAVLAALTARALQRHAKAALRLTKLVGEAEEAAASAERSRIAHDLHDSLTPLSYWCIYSTEGLSSVASENPKELSKPAFARHGIDREESVGQPFDPRYHEAVASRYEPSQPDHIVLEALQRVYHYGSESPRPARVVINDLSKGGSSDSQD